MGDKYREAPSPLVSVRQPITGFQRCELATLLLRIIYSQKVYDKKSETLILCPLLSEGPFTVHLNPRSTSTDQWRIAAGDHEGSWGGHHTWSYVVDS